MINLFGSGSLFVTPTQDASGNIIATPTPVAVGVMQDVSVDQSFDTKMLHGQRAFPAAIGRGKGKCSGKAKFAQISVSLASVLFYGQTLSPGLLDIVEDSAGAAIPAAPYQLTPTVPNGGTWTKDLGVRDANGVALTRVVSAPVTGQYTIVAGLYTFAAADVGKTVFINFGYSATVAGASKAQILSLPMGPVPVFRADLIYRSPQGRGLVYTYPNCVSTKLSLGGKQDDFIISEFDFEMFADANNTLCYISSLE